MRRRNVLAGIGLTPFVGLGANAAMSALNVIELRQYTLRKGRRDELAKLFREHFVEPQERVGAHVLGTFVDRDDPDRFVWFRGFESMDTRAQALETFYSGDVWKAHRSAANQTMLDSDNVLLLHPIAGKTDWTHAIHSAHNLVVFVHNLRSVDPGRFADWFFDKGRRHYESADLKIEGGLVTETAPNTWPRLPVRTGESVFVWWSHTTDESWPDRLRADSGWRDGIDDALLSAVFSKPEIIRLRRATG